MKSILPQLLGWLKQMNQFLNGYFLKNKSSFNQRGNA